MSSREHERRREAERARAREHAERAERAERVDRSERERVKPAKARENEYFVPKNGIDREVITADICRYLGNDALVRPGTVQDTETRSTTQGYFITAYRNLTTEMINDLRADSERWELERRQTASASRGNVEYRSSTTHQARQHYGPSQETPAPTPVAPAAGYGAQGYSQPASGYGQTQVPDYGPSYAQTYSSQPASGYAPSQPAGYPSSTPYASSIPQDPYYVAANYEVDSGTSRGSQPRSVPVVSTGYPSTAAYQQAPDPRSYGQAGPSSVPPPTQYTQQPPDPYYGRGSGYDSAPPEVYDTQYQDARAFSQAPSSSSSSTMPSQAGESSRRRDKHSESDKHHRSSRR